GIGPRHGLNRFIGCALRRRNPFHGLIEFLRGGHLLGGDDGGGESSYCKSVGKKPTYQIVLLGSIPVIDPCSLNPSLSRKHAAQRSLVGIPATHDPNNLGIGR